MRVTIIGAGYVGITTGACLSYLGHRVTCVDTDAAKVETLQRGELPIYENHLRELLHLARVRGGIDFTTEFESVAESDVIFLAVGTPSRPTGEADLSFLESAARRVGSSLTRERHHVIVNKSTVPIGTGNLVQSLLNEGIHARHGQNSSMPFSVASNPEFLREGSAVFDSLYPERIVLGVESDTAMEMLRELYRPILEQRFEAPLLPARPEDCREVPLIVTSLSSAEMIKYAANAFLAMKISFANEAANICEKVGADVTQVMAGIGLDSRIGARFLNAGIGWGGSCFGKDLRSLLHTAGEYGYRAQLLEASLAVNQAQRQMVIHKLQEKLYTLKGRSIALFGLAFKPGTDDLRDAPSLQIAEELLKRGARVRAYDPVAMPACRQQHPELNIQYCNSILDAASGTHAVVVVTEWADFAAMDLEKVAQAMADRVLIDGRNLFDPELARKAGFDYSGVGRGSSRRRPVEHDASDDAAAANSASGGDIQTTVPNGAPLTMVPG
jgi:UDPglucose 6-dehydrogenase